MLWSYLTGELPRDWSLANVAPIFKKGNRVLAENYRPVSLTCITCKLFEHIVCRHILDHVEDHKILTNLQHGFRSGRSCETQLITTTHDLLSSFNSKSQIDVAILDFSKAFDTVPHAGLLGKLEHYGIDSKILLWITNFLNNRKQRVVVDGSFSNYADVESGVPQGTVLGPLLFLLHINDLPSCVNSKVRLFADDCLLYREIKNNQDQIDMQRDLDALMDWGSTWGMKFNAKKCNIMRVSRSRKPLQHFYSLGNEILQEVSDAKYLGIQIDNKLDWNKHISTVAARGQSKLAFLNRNLKGCPKKLRDTAYISLIRPALEYSCSVWHPHKKSNKDKIEKVQRRAARFVSNNFRRKASVSEMLHELGWQSLDDRRQDQRLVLFFKIINGLASVETEDILTPADSRTRKNHSFKFKQLQANCDSYRYSFFPATISSWNNLPFGIEKVDSVEQAYQWAKATHAKDDKVAKKLLYTTNPRVAKNLGRAVKGLTATTWDMDKRDIMRELVKTKFCDDAELKTELLNSKDLKLVEAGLDPFYGIGLTMSSSDIFDPTKWKGKNHLGDILVAIRASLID